jgi:hypothetical protein
LAGEILTLDGRRFEVLVEIIILTNIFTLNFFTILDWSFAKNDWRDKATSVGDV